MEKLAGLYQEGYEGEMIVVDGRGNGEGLELSRLNRTVFGTSRDL